MFQSKKAIILSIIGVFLVLVIISIAGSVLFLKNSGAPALQEKTDTTKTFTLAELSTHNSESDCWTAYEGNVYNLTWFIPTHKGGLQILAQCGQVSDEFSKVHPGGLFSKPSVQAVFSVSRVGTLGD